MRSVHIIRTNGIDYAGFGVSGRFGSPLFQRRWGRKVESDIRYIYLYDIWIGALGYCIYRMFFEKIRLYPILIEFKLFNSYMEFFYYRLRRGAFIILQCPFIIPFGGYRIP